MQQSTSRGLSKSSSNGCGNLLLGGLMSEGGSDGSGHELVCLSALDFYDAVCGICDECNFVAAPSSFLIYRIFPSSIALCTNHVCASLPRYQGVFKQMKAKSTPSVCSRIKTGK